MLKPQYLHLLLCTSRCFREKCRSLFIAVVPQPYQTKPSAFGLNLKRERVSKEQCAAYPHELHTAASRNPRNVLVLQNFSISPNWSSPYSSVHWAVFLIHRLKRALHTTVCICLLQNFSILPGPCPPVPTLHPPEHGHWAPLEKGWAAWEKLKHSGEYSPIHSVRMRTKVSRVLQVTLLPVKILLLNSVSAEPCRKGF